MDNEKEFIKEQEEIMQEVAELNKEHKKYMEELEQERKEGLAEMVEHNKLINELEQERKDGITEMRESLKEYKKEEIKKKKLRINNKIKTNGKVYLLTEKQIKEKENIISNLKLSNKSYKIEIANLKADVLSDILLISGLHNKYYIRRKSLKEYAICDWKTSKECLLGDIEDIKFILEQIIGTRFLKDTYEL